MSIFKKSQSEPPDYLKDHLSDKKELTMKEFGDFFQEQKRLAQYYKDNAEDNYDKAFAAGFATVVESLYDLYRKFI